MTDMGMTDKQFKSYIKLLLAMIDDANSEVEVDAIKARLRTIRECLQSSIEY